MKKKEQRKQLANYINSIANMNISDFLLSHITEPNKLASIRSDDLIKLINEYKPLYNIHILDGPNELTIFKLSIWSKLQNHPELLNYLDNN